MTVKTRFAPSPTGYLHVGNVRTALVNWLFAKSQGGKFMLRIDDTDVERSKEEFVDGIKEDLKWLGLNWDEIHFQSQRMALYEAAKKRLIEQGRLYPCYESQEELEIKKKILLNRNLPPIYDRSALKLSKEQREELEAKGIRPHWRFYIEDKDISWVDGVRSEIKFEAKNISDPVLIRADGSMTYMIASVVDDIDFEISTIIRAEEHITNSAIQIQMFEALAAKAPNMAHLSLIKSKEGKISKRLGGYDIKSMREEGIHPIAILSFLAKLGTSDAIEFRKSHAELEREFSLKKFNKAIATYDIQELERVNTKLVHHLNYQEVQSILPQYIDESFWEKVKTNLNKVNEVLDWWKVCNELLQPVIMDLEFTKEASQMLPNGDWDAGTWNEWISLVKSTTGKSGRDLFMPIRLALTGMEHGPELKNLLPLLGREKAFERLNGRAA